METPIPTPFDIVDPPAGPIVPSGVAWVATALMIVLMLILRWIILRKPKNPSIEGLVSTLLDEVRRATSQPQAHNLVERVARLTKRILSTYVAQEIDSLSSREMRALAASLDSSSDERDRSSASIMNLLADLEELAYAPHGSTAEIKRLVSHLQKALDDHVRRHRPK